MTAVTIFLLIYVIHLKIEEKNRMSGISGWIQEIALDLLIFKETFAGLMKALIINKSSTFITIRIRITCFAYK